MGHFWRASPRKPEMSRCLLEFWGPECQAACPKGIDVKFIAKLNREYIKALLP